MADLRNLAINLTEEQRMQARIVLSLPHNGHHDQLGPVVELCGAPDHEAQVWFEDSGDGAIVLAGCPECLRNLLYNAVRRIEEALATENAWAELDT
jgi:hypothetical protein